MSAAIGSSESGGRAPVYAGAQQDVPPPGPSDTPSSDQARHTAPAGRPHINEIRFAAIRAREIAAVLEDRYGRVLPDDDAGRDDLRLLIQHAAQFRDPRLRVGGVIDAWAPWLTVDERAELEREAFTSPPPRYSADELADRLGLTMAKRQELGLTSIGAIDADKQERERLKKVRRAAKEKARRAEIRHRLALMSARNDAITSFPSRRSERQAALMTALAGGSLTEVKELAEVVGGWAIFRGLSAKSLRRVINRELDELKRSGLITSKCLPTSNPKITQRVVTAAETPATATVLSNSMKTA